MGIEETLQLFVLINLKVGRIFDQDELITSRQENIMKTIRREPDTDEIRWFGYNLKGDGSVVQVNNNGYGEISLEDKNYEINKSKLESAGLWK